MSADAPATPAATPHAASAANAMNDAIARNPVGSVDVSAECGRAGGMLDAVVRLEPQPDEFIVVDNESDKTIAGLKAREVGGVFEVTNNLRVER